MVLRCIKKRRQRHDHIHNDCPVTLSSEIDGGRVSAAGCCRVLQCVVDGLSDSMPLCVCCSEMQCEQCVGVCGSVLPSTIGILFKSRMNELRHASDESMVSHMNKLQRIE
mmetsp:Transcript_19221/g.30630  ORF Transcript_19221/g.30630 Transcript_19221/m.30630 type:complete len:110 (+) Transcript_19221:1869-2198(+)